MLFCLCLFKLTKNLFLRSIQGLGNCLMAGAFNLSDFVCILAFGIPGLAEKSQLQSVMA